MQVQCLDLIVLRPKPSSKILPMKSSSCNDIVVVLIDVIVVVVIYFWWRLLLQGLGGHTFHIHRDESENKQ